MTAFSISFKSRKLLLSASSQQFMFLTWKSASLPISIFLSRSESKPFIRLSFNSGWFKSGLLLAQVSGSKVSSKSSWHQIKQSWSSPALSSSFSIISISFFCSWWKGTFGTVYAVEISMKREPSVFTCPEVILEIPSSFLNSPTSSATARRKCFESNFPLSKLIVQIELLSVRALISLE